MPKSILTMLLLGLIVISYLDPFSAFETTARAADSRVSNDRASIGRASASATFTTSEGRPSVGVRWAGGNERHAITFTPAPAFLLLVGIAGASTLALPMVRLARLA